MHLFHAGQSPIQCQLSDTLVGLQTVLALGMKGSCTETFMTFQDKHTAAHFMYLSTTRFFMFSLIFLGMVYFLSVALLVVAMKGGRYQLL